MGKPGYTAEELVDEFEELVGRLRHPDPSGGDRIGQDNFDGF